MDKRMSKDMEDELRMRMKRVYSLYLQAICMGNLVPLSKKHIPLIYKSLTVRDYKLTGTFWATTAIFYDGSLIAIIAENGVIYSFVNMFSYSPEISCMITQHLADFLKEISMHTEPLLIYPKSDR